MHAQTLAEALSHGYGVERPFLCPVHGDSRPSASVNTLKGLWVCYTCGAKGSVDGEALLLEPDYQQLKLWLAERLEEQRVYPETWIARYDAGPVHPYWLGRVGEAAARRFRLGFDAGRNAVTYPLRRTDGAVLGVVRRSLSEGGPKYRYPRGVDIGGLLFNFSHEALDAVVLCEGALDAIAFWSVGVRAFAIYGARLSDAQVQLIDRVDPSYVYTAFDQDNAGVQVTRETQRRFRHRLVKPLVWPRWWGKDVDEIGFERLREISSDVLEHQHPESIGSSTCGSLDTRKPSSRVLSSTTSTPKKLQIVRSSS